MKFLKKLLTYEIMEPTNTQNTPVQQLPLFELRQCLISGAKRRLWLERKGFSKAKDKAHVCDLARILIDRAEIYTANEQAARHFLQSGADMLQQVLPPTFHKALQKIACA